MIRKENHNTLESCGRMRSSLGFRLLGFRVSGGADLDSLHAEIEEEVPGRRRQEELHVREHSIMFLVFAAGRAVVSPTSTQRCPAKKKILSEF